MNSRGRGPQSLLDRSFAGSTETLNDARVAVADALGGRGVAAATITDAVLVTSELTTNALEAAPGLPYHVTVHLDDAAVIVTVKNQAGPSPAPMPPETEWGPASPLAPRGRGLAIVEAISAEVRHGATADGGYEVRAHLARSGASRPGV